MTGTEQRELFQRNGYVIVEGHLPPLRLAALRAAVEELYAAEGARAGWEQPAVAPFVRRLCNLFAKGDLFVELATDALVLEYAELVIGRPVRWHAMNAHDPLPGHHHPHQAIHADRQHWPQMPAYFNVLWALDDITAENGATRLVPGSHRRPFPAAVLDDPLAPVNGEVLAICPAGSAIMVHGDAWHGARANRSAGPRRMLHLGYAASGSPTQYDIGPTLSPELRRRLALLADRLELP